MPLDSELIRSSCVLFQYPVVLVPAYHCLVEMGYEVAAADAAAVAAATSSGAAVLAAACGDEGKWLEGKHLHRTYTNFSSVQALVAISYTSCKEHIKICWLSLLHALQLF
jgi:hypothetical protein